MRKGTIVTLLTGLNLALLIALLYLHLSRKQRLAQVEQNLKIQRQYNYDDLMPSIFYSKDDKVEVIFREVIDTKNSNLNNCINPNVRKLSKRTKALLTCLPLFKKYKMKAKADNKALIPDIPNYVPKFGELNKISGYPYKDITWKKLYNRSRISLQNPLFKLGFYKNKVSDEMYDDDPSMRYDFETPHMGLYNFDNYCHVHDILILSNKKLAFKKNFVTDYHQMSLLRMFVMNKLGRDMMPKFSKNMPKINWFQKIFTMDLRANMFFFKKASFHAYHKIGKHFNCYGQSYNHIPGHGGLIRKDLLTQLGNEWKDQFKTNEKCRNNLNYFPNGYRLYIRKECKAFFNVLNTKKYEERKKVSPIQFIMKVGHGVHRGAGVQILDRRLEISYREEYDNGKKCGFNNINEVAQEYVGNPALFKGHKFDFRTYMLISSVNPLKVWHHDGFLRVSLSKYDKFSTSSDVHITNTSKSAKIIEKVRKTGVKHLGMNVKQLKNFQYQSMRSYEKYLISSGQIEDKNWNKNYFRKELKKSYIAAAKIIQDKLYKSSNVFEIFGFDIVMDEDFKLKIIEINASPMVIGTAKHKTRMMRRMMHGLFKIVFSQQFSRTKRTLDYIQKYREEIMARKNIGEHKKRFNQLYTNVIEDEFKKWMTKSNPWSLIYDEEIEDKYDKYMGFLDKDCIDLIEE